MSLFLGNSQILWYQLFECENENKTFKASPRALENCNDHCLAFYGLNNELINQQINP